MAASACEHVILVLISVSPRSNGVEHWLTGAWTSFVGQVPVQIFGLFFFFFRSCSLFLISLWEFFIYSGYKCFTRKCPFVACRVSVHSLNDVFRCKEPLNFEEAPFIEWFPFIVSAACVWLNRGLSRGRRDSLLFCSPALIAFAVL